MRIPPEVSLAIYMQDSLDGPFGKMGFGILRYSPNPIACVVDSVYAGRTVRDFGFDRDTPIVATLAEAQTLGASVFVLGIAPLGGMIPPEWYAQIDEAVERGMSVVNGLHDHLAPRYPEVAAPQFIWDIRTEPTGLTSGTGAARHLPGRRVLFIGADMAIGKMTAGLELYANLRDRGVPVEFVATGQIGITITGRGVPLDAIRVDFASGAIEREVIAAADAGAQVTIIEGQGALGHPASSANLPLLRGSMPTDLVLCLKAGQTHLRANEHIPLPPVGDYIRLYEDLASACGTFPRPQTIGVCVNTVEIADDAAARAHLAGVTAELGLPATDPIRFGADVIAERLVR